MTSFFYNHSITDILNPTEHVSVVFRIALIRSSLGVGRSPTLTHPERGTQGASPRRKSKIILISLYLVSCNRIETKFIRYILFNLSFFVRKREKKKKMLALQLQLGKKKRQRKSVKLLF